MVNALQGIGDKIVAVIMAATAVGGGLFSMAQNMVTPSQQTAVVYSAVVSFPPPGIPSGTVSYALPMLATVTPNLLPPVIPVFPKKAPIKKIATTSSAIKIAASEVPAATASMITAQWLLDHTNILFQQKRDGTYEIAFTATSSLQNFTWGIANTSIGGTAGITKFAFSFSCNPPPGIMDTAAPDQTPFFAVRTSYDCTIGFAAMSGSDQVLRSKEVSLTTGAGQLVITPPPSMNTVLGDAGNNGGFVFNNEDTDPVTVTGLTLDVSYTALNILNGPLVLRVLDPMNNTPLFDYHMENLPADPAALYTYAATSIQVPLSLMLGPNSQKLLPIQILGVSPMSILGVDPTVAVTLRAVTTNMSSVPIVLNASKIGWSCVVALTPYDPNATSGVWAMGTACK